MSPTEIPGNALSLSLSPGISILKGRNRRQHLRLGLDIQRGGFVAAAHRFAFIT